MKRIWGEIFSHQILRWSGEASLDLIMDRRHTTSRSTVSETWPSQSLLLSSWDMVSWLVMGRGCSLTPTLTLSFSPRELSEPEGEIITPSLAAWTGSREVNCPALSIEPDKTIILFSGFVTPVLSQDPCNSCAAHAASSATESCLAIASREWGASKVSFYLIPFSSDTAPQPKSQQQLIDCTNGFGTGIGTELLRTNQGCKTAYADVHLLWLQETQRPLLSARDYPLRPDEPAGECPNDAYNAGYGPDYYNYIKKRQVRTRWWPCIYQNWM